MNIIYKENKEIASLNLFDKYFNFVDILYSNL